jgi:hypothetical protein
MLQVTQSTMNDASCTTGGSGGEVALLDDERGATRTSALPRNRHPIDPSADDNYIEAPAIQRRPRNFSRLHLF